MAISSPSSISLEVVKGAFQFKINNSTTKEIDQPGGCITTPAFSFGGCNWVVAYYPKGIDANNEENNIALRIQNQADGKSVTVDYELGLLNKTGRPMAESWVRSTGIFHNMGYSKSCVITRSNLESNYVRGDNFIVVCTISLVNDSFATLKDCFSGVIPNTMGEELFALLERNEKTDVTFELEGENIAAHQLILASRSPVLRKELFDPMVQTICKRRKIDGMKSVVFKGLLHFIYTDSLPNFEDLVSGGSSDISSTVLYQDLLVAANKYQVEGLRTLCEEHLCRTISVGTVLSSLSLAEQHGYGRLKEECLKFMADESNLKIIGKTDEYITLLHNRRSLLADFRKMDDGCDAGGK